ncbi:MAG TPA: hypothetical protein VNJ09_11505 [Chthonomonadales bacterium]|nr:hypothetical protein [Chthonomonadales bacterium]
MATPICGDLQAASKAAYHLGERLRVVDCADTRPVNENNARAGAHSRAGVISIQDHDPSSDLYFRNIQIIEFPPRKQ